MRVIFYCSKMTFLCHLSKSCPYFLRESGKEFVDGCRCFAALGDVAKARYLHTTNQIAEEAAKKTVRKLCGNCRIN